MDNEAVRDLLSVMAHLRDPTSGCPWDVQQNFRTIAPHTIEEAYEVVDAIERDDMDGLLDELGDLLFQVVFYAQMAKEAGRFDFDGVARAITEKMIRRHPHVFGSESVKDADDQSRNWEQIKAEERRSKVEAPSNVSALEGVSVSLPALTRAVKLQRRAARVGFDWPDAVPVLDKIREELGELEAELQGADDGGRVEEEYGDLLFACANLGRHLKVDPEAVLRGANAKFERRFRRMEALLAQGNGAPARPPDLDTMERAWQQVKREEKSA